MRSSPAPGRKVMRPPAQGFTVPTFTSAYLSHPPVGATLPRSGGSTPSTANRLPAESFAQA